MRLSVLLMLYLFCIEDILNIRISRSKSYEPHTFTSCFEDLGCIDTTEKWYHEKHRPKNLEPLDRHTIRTEFLLMKSSKNNSNELLYDVMSLKKETVEVAGFKSGTCTIFVIHDFTSNGYTGWIKHLVIAFSKKTDCNIISVDWQAGAEPVFIQAIANARVVALEAKLFITLIVCGFSQAIDNVHIVGHGVGAHIAGYIGKYVKGIQRITGLDPTGPMFEKMPKEVRLDYDDAKYVEILHTDCFNHRSQGGRILHGHADFFINNADHQPGCNDSSHMPSFLDLHRDTLQEGKILPACSHKRAFKYYIQALEDDECQFIGLKCDSYKSFQLGKCNECGNKGQCATFGLEPPSVTSKNNSYFLSTNGKKPFCMITYAVNITVAKGKSTKDVEGFFDMILVDVDDKVTNATSNIHGTSVRHFESGHTYKFIFYALPPRMGKIKEGKVKWNYKSKKICVFCDKSITVHDIGIKRLSWKNDSNPVNWLCPVKQHYEMKSGDYIEFLSCEDLYGPKYASDHIQPAKTNASHIKSDAMNQMNNSMLLNMCNGTMTSSASSSTAGNMTGSTEIQATTSSSSTSSEATTVFEGVATKREERDNQSNEFGTYRRSDDTIMNQDEVTTSVKEFKDCFDEKTTTDASDAVATEKCENMQNEDSNAPPHKAKKEKVRRTTVND